MNNMEYKQIAVPENENFIVWQDRFAIGIPVIDDEHKRLVELCNELYKEIMTSKSSGRKDAVRVALKDCADYVQTHFNNEEKLMQVCGYKDFDAHKQQHIEFTKKVLEKIQNFDNETFASSLEFVKFLYDWVLSHIAHTDTLYVNDLKAYLAKK